MIMEPRIHNGNASVWLDDNGNTSVSIRWLMETREVVWLDDNWNMSVD